VSGEAEVQKTQAGIRIWCFLAVFAYLIILLVVLAVLIGQDTARHEWWEVFIGPGIICLQVVVLSMFAWGLMVWESRMAWKVRLFAWLILFLGLVPMVSFFIFLAPLLLTMPPSLWPWRGSPDIR